MSTSIQTPLLTVDIIIELEGDRVVLIERGGAPFGTALPGGFVDVGETVEVAAIREAREETHLEVELRELLYVYSRPDRDPRGHSVSVVFIGRAAGEPQPGDDAHRAFACPVGDLPVDFVFDHGQILADYLRFRDSGSRPRP